MNPKPTNVQSFDLSYTDSEGTEHTLKSGYAMTASGTGYVADVVIQLDQAVIDQDHIALFYVLI